MTLLRRWFGKELMRGDRKRLPPTSPTVAIVGFSHHRWVAAMRNSLAGSPLWPDGELEYLGGGDLAAWGDMADPRWDDLESGLAQYGADDIWISFGCRNATAQPLPWQVDAVIEITDRLRALAPATRLVGSPMADIEPPGFCPTIGDGGPAVSASLHSWALKKGRIDIVGPAFMKLDETSAKPGDSCHFSEISNEQMASGLGVFGW